MIYLSRLYTPPTLGIAAGDLQVEQEVLLNENGAPVNYIVVHQGLPGDMYDASCEGTWLLRKDIRRNGQWKSSNVNTLAGSTIMSIMAGFLTSYDAKVQEAIKTVKIPYCVGGGNATVNSGANGLECKIFPLGGYEVGFTTSLNASFPVDGAKLDYFISGNDSAAQQKRIAKLNGSATRLWLRSPHTGSSSSAWLVDSYGGFGSNGCSFSYGLRTTLILPYDYRFQESEVAT